MNIDEYIKAMPKAEINVHLEGYFRKDTLLIISEQNDVPSEMKRYRSWIDKLDTPTIGNFDEITKTVRSWWKHPDDLTRLVYDLAVNLAKQNVKYAEVLVNPITYMIDGMSFEGFLDAINDGRDRAQRGWGINLAWVLTVPRDEPRRADEITRWTMSAAAKKGNVVGFGLVGSEDKQPVGQFERAFSNTMKKDVPRLAQAGSTEGAHETLTHLEPDRLLDGWGVLESAEILDLLSEIQTPMIVSPEGSTHKGWIDSVEVYPLRELMDENVKIIIGCDLPTYYDSSLTQHYQDAVNKCGMTIEELEEMVITTLEVSWMPEDEKAQMISDFLEDFGRLRIEMTPG